MTGLVLRRGTYYYRQRIPTDLRHLFDQGHIRRSLHTTDANAAKTLAASCAARVQHTFSLLRTGALHPAEAKALAANLLGANLADVKGNGRQPHPGTGQSSPAGDLLTHSADVTASMQPLLAPLTLGQVVERFVAEHVARHMWTARTHPIAVVPLPALPLPPVSRVVQISVIFVPRRNPGGDEV